MCGESAILTSGRSVAVEKGIRITGAIICSRVSSASTETLCESSPVPSHRALPGFSLPVLRPQCKLRVSPRPSHRALPGFSLPGLRPQCKLRVSPHLPLLRPPVCLFLVCARSANCGFPRTRPTASFRFFFSFFCARSANCGFPRTRPTAPFRFFFSFFCARSANCGFPRAGPTAPFRFFFSFFAPAVQTAGFLASAPTALAGLSLPGLRPQCKLRVSPRPSHRAPRFVSSCFGP